MSAYFAEILGLLCAEGSHIQSFSNYYGKDGDKIRYRRNKKSERIEFYSKDVNLIVHYQYLLAEQFKYFPKITKHGKIIICTHKIINAILSCTPLGHLNWRVPDNIINASDDAKLAFIRGYFDGDGSAVSSIRFFSTNQFGLEQVSKNFK